MTFDEISKFAKAMVESGFFTDVRQIAQAVVKIQAGSEMGIKPFAAMTGIHIIQGKPTIGANLLAACVKRSGRYDYRIAQLDEKVCEIIFYDKKEEIGRSLFTIEDARKAGTKNLDKFPRNMLFARSMSNGVKWFCPDALGDSPIYTPDELGADVDEEGNVIPGTYTEVQSRIYLDGTICPEKNWRVFDAYVDAMGNTPESYEFLKQWAVQQKENIKKDDGNY